MSKKDKPYRNADPFDPCYGTNAMQWSAATLERQLYSTFFSQIVALAMSRFEWINLPPSCNERFLEWSLLTDGFATIAFPKRQPGVFYSTQAVQEGVPNVYMNPSRWRSYGTNDWSFRCDNTNGVFLYDNLARVSIWGTMQVYARELTDIMRTKQINRMHARTPFLITAPQEQKSAVQSVYQQIVSGESAVLGYEAFNTAVKVEAIQTGVEYLGSELQQDLLNVWGDIYRFLGIPNMPMKMERQIEDEVHNYEAPTETFRLNPLTARREACHKLNRRFEKYLNGPVDCVFRTDYASHNLKMQRDIKARLEAMD